MNRTPQNPGEILVGIKSVAKILLHLGHVHKFDKFDSLSLTGAVGLFRGGVKIALAKFCILKSHFTVTCTPYKEIHVTQHNLPPSTTAVTWSVVVIYA